MALVPAGIESRQTERSPGEQLDLHPGSQHLSQDLVTGLVEPQCQSVGQAPPGTPYRPGFSHSASGSMLSGLSGAMLG